MTAVTGRRDSIQAIDDYCKVENYVPRQNIDPIHNQRLTDPVVFPSSASCLASFGSSWGLFRLFDSRKHLLLENLALRQHLALLKVRRKRPKLRALDKLSWALMKRIWSGWKRSLLVVTPETVVRRDRAGFRLNWRWISKRSAADGRKRTSREPRDLIFQIVRENSS